MNVSAAKVAPWERPELRKRIDLSSKPDFDTLIFWKLDRLVRSVGDFARLIEWAVAYDVNLISTDGSVDLSTPMGKAMAQIVAVFAELEAAIIKERVNDSRPVVLADGRWHGGRHPWGYKPVKADGGGWRLIEDKEASPVLRELIDRVIGGEPMYAVQQDFAARGIRTPKGGQGRMGIGQRRQDSPLP